MGFFGAASGGKIKKTQDESNPLSLQVFPVGERGLIKLNVRKKKHPARDASFLFRISRIAGRHPYRRGWGDDEFHAGAAQDLLMLRGDALVHDDGVQHGEGTEIGESPGVELIAVQQQHHAVAVLADQIAGDTHIIVVGDVALLQVDAGAADMGLCAGTPVFGGLCDIPAVTIGAGASAVGGAHIYPQRVLRSLRSLPAGRPRWLHQPQGVYVEGWRF